MLYISECKSEGISDGDNLESCQRRVGHSRTGRSGFGLGALKSTVSVLGVEV
jgi:hypothetical protein